VFGWKINHIIDGEVVVANGSNGPFRAGKSASL
jgi:hypothetical protein